MEVFQHGQRDEITRLETEISTLTHAMGDDPDDLHAQVLQLRTERNDFERHAISAREDLHNAETDRDRLRLEAVQDGDEIRDLQAQISSLERKTDDARSESATALASYNRISSSLTRSPSDRGRDPSPSRSARLVQTQRDRALADLAFAQANLTQVTSDRDRAFKQLARATEDRDRALSDRDSALRLRDLAVTARDQARLDLLTETARTAQLDDDLEVVRLELQERERNVGSPSRP
ncbi:Zinc ion binding protein [Phytophthora megakarya]|uniref:Zinc ion binding protein n=1 Tax=Phytophthora megakarya TaxID=4795 RepID=A0A225UIE0_9STRA|nr:Zinc ion binding protein [Phytophthora megakarya]